MMTRNIGIGVSSAALAVLVCAAIGGAAKFNRKVDVGQRAPDWGDLVGIDDQTRSLKGYSDAKVVVLCFTCNHCPVATAYEDRFIRFVNEFKDKGVAFVAVNVSNLPQDRLPKMRQRAQRKGFNFDYLYDPSQEIGRAYGATVTPHVFVLDQDRRIAYMGAFDNSQDPAKVKHHYVRDAVDALLAGRRPEVKESLQFGCGITYEKASKTEKRVVAVRVVNRAAYDAVLKGDEYRGKVILVDFWATWCIPCIKEFPHTVEWSRKYADQGLAVVSVSMDDPDQKDEVLKFLKKQQATFTNLLSDEGISENAVKAFDIAGGALPHYKIYNRSGQVVRTFGGDPDKPLNHEEIESALRKVLGSKP